MTASGSDAVAGAAVATNKTDENNQNVDNLKGSDALPMEVDEKPETSTEGWPVKEKEVEEDPREVHERKAKQFMKELTKFHENSGTPIVRHPKINGKDVDLYELYTEMTKLGGWVKVNTRNDWDELLENLAFPKSCVNAAVAIKYIYNRYLDRYEKLHFLGEEDNRVDEDDEDMRQKKLNARLHNVPMTYNHQQHYVNESTRLAHKLSTDYYKPTQNEKLFLSLLSPLPNEQNFALNVCMLISNEPVSTFVHLDKCPKLIDALLAHAGVYSHYSLREIFTEFYSSYRKHSLQTFWNDCLSDKPHILELSFGDISESLDGEIVSLDDKESEGAQEAAQHEVISSFLNLKRGAGTQDYIGLRVQQIATILRNLSFVEENTFLFAHSRTFLRFLVMCSNIRWNNLHHMALDMLGNIAEDIDLADPVTDDLTRCLLATIMDGLESEDRGIIISCMEVLYKLCRRTNNEDYLYRAFDKAMYAKITSFLWLKDAMLVMYTLECMYELTNLGEKTCNGFVHVRGIIDSLVSLVTLEAKTFGQEGCILMCVVDKQAQGSVPTVAKPVVAAAVTAPTPQITNSPVKVPLTPKPATNAATTSQVSVVTPQKVNARSGGNIAAGTKTPLSSKQSQQQAHQENEQNAQEWMRSTYEAGEVGKDRVDMQELYRLYVTAMSKLKRGGVVSPAFFPKVVKAVFGPAPGPIKDQGTPFYTGIRAKLRQTVQEAAPAAVTPAKGPPARVVTIPTNKPAFSLTPSQAAGGAKPNTIIQQVTSDGTHVITTVAAVQAAAAAAGKQQPNHVQQKAPGIGVVNTNSGMTITPVQPGTVIASPKPVQQQQQQKQIIRTIQQQTPQQQVSQGQPIAGGSTSHAPSSLIKSLLANKVTTAPVIITKSPLKTVTTTTTPMVPTSMPLQGLQSQKTQFFINPTNTNQVAVQPPPAGAVAAASVIMSSVAAAQSARPTASVPIINNSSKLLQVSPNKTLISSPGAPGITIKSHPPLISTTNPSPSTTTIINANSAMNVRQVVQRQQIAKQKKELAQRGLLSSQMKPGMMTTVISSPQMDSSQPPPLAPLSGGSGQKVTVLKMNSTQQVGGTPVIITTNPQQQQIVVKEETISQLDGMTPPFGDEGTDDEDAAKQQTKATSNKMLADLLEKKSDPPTFAEAGGSTSGQQTKATGKRKMSAEGGTGPSTKRKGSSDEPAKATPSAANLYAEMAASILEDDESIEDEDTEEDISMEEEQQPTPAAPQMTIKTGPGPVQQHQQQQQQVITVPMRQQIIMPPSGGQQQQQQMILTGSHQQTATIKTETGYQTVPILMQQQQQGGPTQGVGTSGSAGIIQQRPGTTAVHAGQTQYVLATNPQGQTYVVATQSPMQQQMQTLLVTQTPQQQGTQQKTIIILQQQPQGSNQGASGGAGQSTATPIQQAINSQGQKIIMTTTQGQQVVMTGAGPAAVAGGGVVPSQVQVQPQRQIVIQQHHHHQGGNAQASNIIVSGAGGPGQVQKQIILTQQPQQQQFVAVKAPAPMDAVSSVDNIPQHIIKTSTGLQIKPVHIQATQPPSLTAVQPQPQSQAVTVIQGVKAQQPVASPSQVHVPIQPTVTGSASSSPVPQSAPSPKMATVTTSEGTITVTTTTTPAQPPQSATTPVPIPTPTPPPTQPPALQPAGDNGVDINWPYVCDWRGCPRRKFKSADEVFYHACKAHCPDTLDFDAEIFCQWGMGPNLCDGKPRKRFSLMTHFQDRHCTDDKFAAAVQRRLEKGIATSNLAHPITIIRDVTKDGEGAAAASAATPATLGGAKKEEDHIQPTAGVTTTTGSTQSGNSAAGKRTGKPGTWQPTAEAVSIIKRREFKDTEFTKAWKDDNEGPVSISIRLTASLILRNLVTYSDVAKRMLKSHESHLSHIALSNVESSRTIAQVLYEMNDIHPV